MIASIYVDKIAVQCTVCAYYSWPYAISVMCYVTYFMYTNCPMPCVCTLQCVHAYMHIRVFMRAHACPYARIQKTSCDQAANVFTYLESATPALLSGSMLTASLHSLVYNPSIHA
jgi:hypothetical protein